MRKKVSDYIADFLAENGIRTIFTVTGGGAMHLNDSFDRHKKLECIYNHHEQASAMAAEGYARIHNRMAAVCVTSGPGALNALNGVAGAYQDSIPMLVFSGQVKLELTIQQSGLNLRTLGNQEFPIVTALSSMTKYAVMLTSPAQIRCCLEKAFYLAKNKRPGPAWLDIPLDIQGAYIETESLYGFWPESETMTADFLLPSLKSENSQENMPDKLPEPAVQNQQSGQEIIPDKLPGLAVQKSESSRENIPDKLSAHTAEKIISRLKSAQRPVIYAGNGIRLSGGKQLLHQFSEAAGIPVVTCWDSIDLIETEHPLYAGRGGTMGSRAGNFAVQNSDLLLCIGTRLNIYQTGYDVRTWVRGAYTVVADIDPEELKKPTMRADLPVCADASDFMRMLLSKLPPGIGTAFEPWAVQCRVWKERYPVVTEKHRSWQKETNVYAFFDVLSRMAGNGSVTVASNGSASVVGSQSYVIGKDQRFILNCGMSSMGYGIAAAIGACLGTGRRDVICIEGDGSLQMNIQELQTVVTNRLPIKLFVINNGGYHQIRQTQKRMFSGRLAGVGPESGDLEFPQLEKIAEAYRMPYFVIRSNESLSRVIGEVLSQQGCCLCEVICSKEQEFEPKLSAKKLPDGTIVSPPLEDMAPFLPREELRENMYIPLAEE